MKKIFLVVLLSFIALQDFACMNESYVRADGAVNNSEFWLGYYHRAFDTAFSQKFVDYYDLNKKDSIPYEELSDVSVNLAKLGRYDESLSLLLWLYQRHPDDYRVNANLGTVYELTGNNDSAYYFIEKSIQLNSESHRGTEWVHLAILRAKKQMAKNPDWIYKNKVLNFHHAAAFEPDSSLMYFIMDSLEAVNYQMQERIPFSPVPNPLIANIFAELGDMLATHYSVHEAYGAYLVGQAYDPDNKFGIPARMAKIKSKVEKEGLGVPVLSDHLSGADEFSERPAHYLPGYVVPTPATDDTMNIGGSPNVDVTYSTWLPWACIGGTIALLGGVIFFARKKS